MGRWIAVLLLAAAVPAQAQMFKDGALDALYAADRIEDLERAGRARPADDPQGLLALALAAIQANDGARRQSVLGQAEACVQKQPKAAICHYVLGAVLGVHAASEGMMKLAGSVGRVKEALHEAFTLEPRWYPARGALVEFYALVPGLMGGSSAKARELAKTAPRPEEAKALQARLALQDGEPEAALDQLAALPPLGDSALAADVEGWGRAAAFAMLNKGQTAKPKAHFERMMKARPDTAWPAYGLGRVMAETGSPAEALKLYEQSARLRGSSTLPLDYRAGIALQALGRNDDAKGAFKRALAAGKGGKAALEDAKSRLESLGG